MCEEGQLCLDLGAPLDPFLLLMIVSAGLITRLLHSFSQRFCCMYKWFYSPLWSAEICRTLLLFIGSFNGCVGGNGLLLQPWKRSLGSRAVCTGSGCFSTHANYCCFCVGSQSRWNPSSKKERKKEIRGQDHCSFAITADAEQCLQSAVVFYLLPLSQWADLRFA